MQVIVDRSVDADTDWLTAPDGSKFKSRAAGVESYESQDNLGKASSRGKDQTAKSKLLVRPGDELEIPDNPERGKFGRALVSPTKMYGEKKVDINAMKASLGINSYYTKYGVSEDSHDILKSTYNEWLPYKFGDDPDAMTQEEYVETGSKMHVIQQTLNQLQAKGDKVTPEEDAMLDAMIGDTFGDEGQKRVSNFLDIKKRLEVMRDRENMPLSPEKVVYEAFKDPRMRKEWDRAVVAKQGRDDVRLAHKGKKTFLQEAGAAMQLYNDVSNFVDRDDLWLAKNVHLENADEILADSLSEIPMEMRGAVTDQARKYGTERAILYAEQLKEDIADNSIFDNMGFAKQFLYGAAAIITSPLSAVAGAKGFQLAAKASKAIRGWEAHGALKAYGYTKVWTAAAGADALLINGPRLVGDHTYTPRDMVLDVALDTAMGAALPMVFMGGSNVVKPHIKKYLTARALDKQKNTARIEESLKHENIKANTEDTNVSTMLKGVHGREETRRLNTRREEAATSDGQESATTPKGDTPTTGSSTGNGPEPNVPPIGARPAVMGDDGVPRASGEVDVDRSLAVGSKWEKVWDQADYTAAKKTGLRLDQRKNWTDEEAAKFNKAYTKSKKDGELSTQELDAIESQQRAEDIVDGGWLDSGLDAVHTAAKKAVGIAGKIGQGLANLTGRAMSHSLQQSENAVMRFIGHNLLEDPTGYAGFLKRHPTAALVSMREKNIGLSQVLPNYAQNIDSWASAKGTNFMERFRASWGTPDGNKLAKQFENEFIDALNARKMGKKVDIDPHVKKMLDDWQKFTDHMGNRAITERLPGFGKLRTNYFPQIRNNQKMANLIEKDATRVTDLERMFETAMINSRDAGLHTLEDADIQDLAKKIVKQAKTGEKDLPDSKSSKLGRAQARVEMDWSAEYNGLKVRDYLETDIALTADKYTSDIGGRLGLNKVTGGKITTDSDLQGLKDIAFAKHADAMDKLNSAGKSAEAGKLDKAFNKEVRMMDDTFNMVLGRPPRGGLAPELRHLKQFTMLTRMGILGTSQSIESGNIIARSTMDLFNDREVLKHMLSMDPSTPEGKVLLDDIMNITGRTKDMEYLHRPSQVLDEESMKSYGNLRQMSIMLADKVTGGDLKQPASRLLGKTSMFNWVQKNQSEYVQKSFLIHTDRYFTTGKSNINPKRMVDLGLINRDGTNTELSKVFNEVVKKNAQGHIVDLQWDKWSKNAKEQYMDAAQRDEAQRLQQTFAGEAPAYYNKPLMNLLFQFREVPLVAQNKQLARNFAFADKEACASVMLNFAIAGMVRYGWVGGMGYAKAVAEGETDNYNLPGLDRLDVMRYMASGGMFPDILETAQSGFQAYNQQDVNQLGRQLPAYGVLKDGMDFGLGWNATNNRAEALQGLTLLGNTWYMDVLHTMLVKNINEMATHSEEGE